jgi:hypothetical protein
MTGEKGIRFPADPTGGHTPPLLGRAGLLLTY